MDVDSEPLNSQDNVEDCLMTGVEENVNCTCDCGDSSSKFVVVTADDIINQTFEISDATYYLYVRYARFVRFRVRKGDTARGKYGTQRRRPSRGYGYANVGFTKKDLDNHIERTHHAKLIGEDSNATISYLLGKADVDPMAMTRYSATDESRLANLFWADGICRADYQCFEDVLAFDTTYRKNKYRRPLVIFSGCNHHRQTCIFGFALIENEQTPTYTWLSQNFLDVMLNKSPSIVVTYGDEVIKAAIQEIFPNATHRLCGWHIQKNITANIKSKGFSDNFRRWLYAPWHPDEFEEYWKNMIKKYGLEENEWVLNEYQKRKSWASAYLRDKFCAEFRTTSRDYRHNELVSQFKTVYGEPMLTTRLAALELCAANFYTREMFGKVKTEIEGVVALDVINEENISTIVVLKVKECDRGQQYTPYFMSTTPRIWSVNVVGGVVKAFLVATCFVP
ncbi:protein FAR-RED IMPAIRED RESPONSE 1-like [Arachis duranensis]|uniref:Protein FAR-RED IMPAIRED RESPONSE 1-like n=1 Tax=Arachis duranensis TaxID=130453 RepID=A0A9C6TBU0_ARADU|nr:protein FAR-RED IMPAIRED RESPONSE 1-like [Arachis duranensis]